MVFSRSNDLLFKFFNNFFSGLVFVTVIYFKKEQLINYNQAQNHLPKGLIIQGITRSVQFI